MCIRASRRETVQIYQSDLNIDAEGAEKIQISAKKELGRERGEGESFVI